VICGNPAARSILIALELGSLFTGWREFGIVTHVNGCTWRQGAHVVELPRPVMPGAHQVNNMATAAAAVVSVYPASLDRQPLLAKGLSSVQLPGRLQQHPCCKRVWLDVGHNPHAAQAVADACTGWESVQEYAFWDVA
jgi:dihydrofolate synthase/folylpolyglutamate synthase